MQRYLSVMVDDDDVMVDDDDVMQLILSPMHGKQPRVELKKVPFPRQHSLALLTPESSVPSQLLGALLKHWISGKNTK